MRLLLDTHVMIWVLSDPSRLAETAADAIADPANEVVVSAVSAWEVAIKQSLGKLDLPEPAETWLPRALSAVPIPMIDVTAAHALAVRPLPWHHRDPFDRLLVAQGLSGYTVVTDDARFAPYGVPVLWT